LFGLPEIMPKWQPAKMSLGGSSIAPVAKDGPNTPQWRLESAEQCKEREFLEGAGTWTG